jgi:hypothetical protein
METAKEFLTTNPHYGGIFIALVGVMGVLASIFNWNWVFGNVSGVTYNLEKIDGWVNIFGRKAARIVFGILSFLAFSGGVLWFWIYAFYYN